ncbi:MAG TPA: methionyl-tRNA formyltransferase [Acidimicrobiales bacterium]|nr:methionyl-tRNA formyltransferase [Acidimicrobiales bacterium]
MGPRPERLVFLGSPEAAVPPLRALVAAGFDVALVVSQPDRKRGRGGALVPSPVKSAAVELGIPVTDRVDDVVEAGADLGVVVAYGRLVKPHVLDRLPMVNLHFSLLPRWRGAAPVERAVLAGDGETGVCLMALEEGLDTGPVYACEVVAIDPMESVESLRNRLVAVGTDLLVAHLTAGLGELEPQQGVATYAAKIDPAELRIDWSRPAAEIHALTRLGRAWTTFRGKRLKVLAARPGEGARSLEPGGIDGVAVGSGDGWLELVEVQPEGKGAQAADAWRNGARPGPDDRLGQ